MSPFQIMELSILYVFSPPQDILWSFQTLTDFTCLAWTKETLVFSLMYGIAHFMQNVHKILLMDRNVHMCPRCLDDNLITGLYWLPLCDYIMANSLFRNLNFTDI